MPVEDLYSHYAPEFYRTANQGSLRSGAVVVPRVLELLQPTTIVDVGCGQGEWLSVAAAHGVDVFGIDGPHVSDEQLLIPRDKFLRHDLSTPMPLVNRFDVALSVEVAEHLPVAASEAFVEALTRLAPAVVFSAALPGQGGINHVNEQWPWFWRDLFARHGYVRLDPFRHALWNSTQVAFYYKQNLYLFVKQSEHSELIESIGVPDRLEELTLVKTTILQDLVRPSRLALLVSRILGRRGR